MPPARNGRTRAMKSYRPLLLLLALVSCRQEEPETPVLPGKPWLGVSGLAPKKAGEVPEAGGHRFAQGLQISAVIAGSPADKAGMKAGDTVVEAEGTDFSANPDDLARRFREAIGRIPNGGRMHLKVVRDWVERDARLDGKKLEDPAAVPEALLAKAPPGPRYALSARRRIDLLDLNPRLEPLPGTRTLPSDEAIFPGGFPESPEEKLARALVTQEGWDTDVQDLLRRLSAAEENPDSCRLTRLAYAHRNPYRMPQVAQRLIRETVLEHPALPERIRRAAAWLDHPFEPLAPHRFAPAGQSLDARLDEITAVLAEAKTHYDLALAKLSPDDVAYLNELLDHLLKSLTEDDSLPPRLLGLTERVEFSELYRSAAVLAGLVEAVGQDGPFLQDLKAGFRAAAKPKIVRETPLGPIVLAGEGHDWHQEEAAVLIDLGGDDFYTSHAGASGTGRPFSILVDCAGNDAYESSRDWSQGCGRLGVGILADLGGNDEYLAQDWGQGVSTLGVGVLLDSNGDDAYRGGDCLQGCALWGLSLLLDGGGNDAYSATCYAQACGMPGGLGLLADEDGDDRYYAKGRHATGYGEPGLFDGMSQGAGFGFRGSRTSGGIGLLADLKGNDQYQAGHFSQGGGYYFGWGLLYEGSGNDTYMGSRYAQGFAAHQAVGYFEDAAGDDRYGTRQGVAQGCSSWDETTLAFLERGGNDVYDGGFSGQGAAAQNGFCLFVDYGGDDVYRGGQAPARGGPNEYHEGTSLSVFVDAGGGKDRYEHTQKDVDLRNDALHADGAHGVIVDLPGKLEEADLKALAR